MRQWFPSNDIAFLRAAVTIIALLTEEIVGLTIIYAKTSSLLGMCNRVVDGDIFEATPG